MTAGHQNGPVCALFVLVLGANACGGGNVEQPPRRERSDARAVVVRIQLKEENRSGHRGEAVTQPGEGGRSGLGGGGGDGLRVTITLSTDTGESNHAHVHSVTCAEYRSMSSYSERFGTVVDTLRDLDGGQSDTVVPGVAVADRTTGRFSINVHKQAQ